MCDVTCTTASGNTQPRWQPTTAGDAVVTATVTALLLAKISRYIAPSILPSIRCSRPVPFAEKHTQSMTFLPPCFTVGMVFLRLYSSFFLQTWRVEFIPKSYILVSSDHMTFSHASSGSSRLSLANFRRAWTCAGLSRGTLRALQDFNP